LNGSGNYRGHHEASVRACDRLARSFVALGRFTGERFPPWATVPMAALLYAAPASLGHPAPLEAAKGVLATFLGLLCLRIADDLEDIDHDRAFHPERGLCSGRIDPARLRDANLALGAALIALESSSVWRLAFFLGAYAFYGAWYAFGKARLHAVARPFFSNLVFPCAVLHGAGPAAWRASAPLALYAWLVAVAHEFAHSVRSVEEEATSGPGYARALGTRGAAVLSVALFAAAALAAVLVWLVLGRPRAFGVALVAAVGGLGFFLAQLLRDPGPQHSRALYRAGILFGLAPALGLLLPR
jgi:4-hydroxybenzoate polyprenyltransferase